MLLFRQGATARTRHLRHCVPYPIQGVVQTASLPGQPIPTNLSHRPHGRRGMPRSPFGSLDLRPVGATQFQQNERRSSNRAQVCRGRCFAADGFNCFSYIAAVHYTRIVHRLKYLAGLPANQVHRTLFLLPIYHGFRGNAAVLHNDVNRRKSHLRRRLPKIIAQ